MRCVWVVIDAVLSVFVPLPDPRRERRLGVCPDCHTSVFMSDPRVRYRRRWFHADSCGARRRRELSDHR